LAPGVNQSVIIGFAIGGFVVLLYGIVMTAYLVTKKLRYAAPFNNLNILCT
jgi:hypothetical protein